MLTMIMSPSMRTFVLIALFIAQMPSRDASVSAALTDLEKGRVLESIQQFKQVVRADPTNSRAYFYLATVYTELREYAYAERYLQRAMQLNPNQGEHYYQLGLIRFRQQQWHPALDSFKQALKTGFGRNEAPVWRSIGDVQLELFDRQAALEAYTEAVRLQPRDARTHLALGRFYQDRGDSSRAIEELRAALEVDPSLRALYPLLGRAYQQSGDLPSAVALLKRALDLDPADQESRYVLGRVLLAMGRADEGRTQLDKYESIRQQVGAAESDFQKAVSSLADGKVSEAEALLRESIRLAPNYGPSLQSLGTLLLDRGSPDKALGFLERSAQVNPLNSANWCSVGRAYFKTGKLTEALAAAERAVAIDEDNKEYQELLKEVQRRVRK